jgi:hypothetical protein
MSMWSASHSGQLSVIMTVTERAFGSWLHRPCKRQNSHFLARSGEHYCRALVRRSEGEAASHRILAVVLKALDLKTFPAITRHASLAMETSTCKVPSQLLVTSYHTHAEIRTECERCRKAEGKEIKEPTHSPEQGLPGRTCWKLKEPPHSSRGIWSYPACHSHKNPAHTCKCFCKHTCCMVMDTFQQRADDASGQQSTCACLEHLSMDKDSNFLSQSDKGIPVLPNYRHCSVLHSRCAWQVALA